MKGIRWVAIVLITAACGTASEVDRRRSTPAPAKVTTTIAAERPLPRTFDAGGIVRAGTTAEVSSRIVAPVVAVLVAPGDRVRAGQPLVTLDGRDLQAHARQAAAVVDAAQYAISAAEAERDAARAALALARSTHDRIAMLHGRRSATARELDEAVAALRSAEARDHAAAGRWGEAGAGLIAAREAGTAADVAVSYTVITAPFAGTVVEERVDPGSLAMPGAMLVRVEDTSRFQVEVHLDEARVGDVSVGERVSLLLPGRYHETSSAHQREMTGRIVEISHAGGAGAHSFLVKIELQPAPGLRSGTYVRARFTGPPRTALVVPKSAILAQGQLATMFVAASGRARLRVVNVRDAGDDVEILAGITAGDVVITSPPPHLRDGDAMETIGAEGDDR